MGNINNASEIVIADHSRDCYNGEQAYNILKANDYLLESESIYPEDIILSDRKYKISFDRVNKIKSFQEKVRDFKPSNIDSFLKNYPEYHEIGKDMIARCILLQEDKNKLTSSENNWYKFLIEAITRSCKSPKDIHKNKLKIITFNYDLSLEYYLYDKLRQKTSA